MDVDPFIPLFNAESNSRVRANMLQYLEDLQVRGIYYNFILIHLGWYLWLLTWRQLVRALRFSLFFYLA